MGLLAEASNWYRATALPLVVSSEFGVPPAWLPVESSLGVRMGSSLCDRTDPFQNTSSSFAVSLDPVDCTVLGNGFVDAVLRKVSEEAFCLPLVSGEEGRIVDSFRAVERTATSVGLPGLAPPYTDAINCMGIGYGGRPTIGSNDHVGRRGDDGVPSLVSLGKSTTLECVVPTLYSPTMSCCLEGKAEMKP